MQATPVAQTAQAMAAAAVETQSDARRVQRRESAERAAAGAPVNMATAAPAAAAFALGLKQQNTRSSVSPLSPSAASTAPLQPRSPSPSGGNSSGGDSYTRHLHDTIRDLQARVSVLSKDNVIKAERIALQEEQLRDKQAALSRQDSLYRSLFASLLVSQFVKSWKSKRSLFRLQDLIFNLLPFVIAEYERAPSSGTTFDSGDAQLRASSSASRGSSPDPTTALHDKERRAAAAARRAAAQHARKLEEEEAQSVAEVNRATTGNIAEPAAASTDGTPGSQMSSPKKSLSVTIEDVPAAIVSTKSHSGGSLYGVVALQHVQVPPSPIGANGRIIPPPTTRRARAAMEEQMRAQSRHQPMDITPADVARMRMLRRVRKGERVIQTPLIQFSLYLEESFSLIQQATIALLQRLPVARAEAARLAERNIELQSELRDAIAAHAGEKTELKALRKEVVQLRHDHQRLRTSYDVVKERLANLGGPAGNWRLGRETRINNMATQFISKPEYRRPTSRAASQPTSRASSAGRSRSASPAGAAGVGAAARRLQPGDKAQSALPADDDGAETDFLFPGRSPSASRARPTSATVSSSSSSSQRQHSTSSSLKKPRPASAAVSRSTASLSEEKDGTSQPPSQVSSSRRQVGAQHTASLDDDDEADAAALNPRTAGRERSRYVRRPPTLSPQRGHPMPHASWNSRPSVSMREKSPGRPTHSFTSSKRFDMLGVGGTNILLDPAAAADILDYDAQVKVTHDIYANATQHAQYELARLRPSSSPSRRRKLQASASEGKLYASSASNSRPASSTQRPDFQSRVEAEAESRAARVAARVGRPGNETLMGEYVVAEPAEHGDDSLLPVRDEDDGDSDLDGFTTGHSSKHPSATRTGRTQGHHAAVSYLRPSDLLSSMGSSHARSEPRRERSRSGTRGRGGVGPRRESVERTLDFHVAEDEDLSQLIVGSSGAAGMPFEPAALVHIASRTVETRTSPMRSSPATSKRLSASPSYASPTRSSSRAGSDRAQRSRPASAAGTKPFSPIRVRSDVRAQFAAEVTADGGRNPSSPTTRSRTETASGHRARVQSASRKKRPGSAVPPPPLTAAELAIQSFGAGVDVAPEVVEETAPAPVLKDRATILAEARDYDSYLAELEAHSPKKSESSSFAPAPRLEEVEPIATLPPFALSPVKETSVLTQAEEEKLRIIEEMHAERKAARARLAQLEEQSRLAKQRAEELRVTAERAAAAAAAMRAPPAPFRAAPSPVPDAPPDAARLPSRQPSPNPVAPAVLDRQASRTDSAPTSSRLPAGSAAAAVSSLAAAHASNPADAVAASTPIADPAAGVYAEDFTVVEAVDGDEVAVSARGQASVSRSENRTQADDGEQSARESSRSASAARMARFKARVSFKA